MAIDNLISCLAHKDKTPTLDSLGKLSPLLYAIYAAELAAAVMELPNFDPQTQLGRPEFQAILQESLATLSALQNMILAGGIKNDFERNNILPLHLIAALFNMSLIGINIRDLNKPLPVRLTPEQKARQDEIGKFRERLRKLRTDSGRSIVFSAPIAFTTPHTGRMVELITVDADGNEERELVDEGYVTTLRERERLAENNTSVVVHTITNSGTPVRYEVLLNGGCTAARQAINDTYPAGEISQFADQSQRIVAYVVSVPNNLPMHVNIIEETPTTSREFIQTMIERDVPGFSATSGEEDTLCTICQDTVSESLGRPIAQLRCHHAFCVSCIHEQFSERSEGFYLSCPNCRAGVTPASGFSGLDIELNPDFFRQPRNL